MLAKQKKFCEEYLKDLNATQAALRAGYSARSAYSIGSENLKKPDIKAYIAELVGDSAINAAETVKLISDISRASLNDYFIVKMVEHRPLIKKRLKVILKEMKAKFLFEEEFIARCGLPEEQLKTYQLANADLDLEILRVEMELARNPKATRIVEGEPELIEQVELDLVKLAKDKEAGRIKSFVQTQYGPKVELYAADAALRDMAKINKVITNQHEVKVGLDFGTFLMENNTVDDDDE